jgi:sortase A
VRWARIIGGIGRFLIGTGVLLLLFVAYQLWGTGLQESRSQRSLTREFEKVLEAATPSTTPQTVSPGSGPTSTTTTEPPLPPPSGKAVAMLEIPKIGLRKAVVQGVGVPDLKRGPGHYPDTPMPGQAGNAAIAGHRTTYGAPVFRLNDLEPDDVIRVRTLQGLFEYRVSRTEVVRPNQLEVLRQTKDAELTLTTCEPRYSARRRLVVHAVLQDHPAPSPTTTTSTTSTTAASTATTRPQRATTTTIEPLEEHSGLSGDPTARWPTFLYGFLTALIGFAIWLAGRRWKRLAAYLIGAPVFFIALYVFFENVSRLLPANI